MTRDRGDRPVKGTGRIGSPGSADRSSQSLARSLTRAFKTVGLVDPRPTSIDSTSGNETSRNWNGLANGIEQTSPLLLEIFFFFFGGRQLRIPARGKVNSYLERLRCGWPAAVADR